MHNMISFELLEQMVKWIVDYPSTFFAAGTALSISALMSLYDGQSILKTFTGSLVCGIVTFAAARSLEYLNIPSNAVTFVGALIGFMGADKVRNKVTDFIETRIKRMNDRNK